MLDTDGEGSLGADSLTVRACDRLEQPQEIIPLVLADDLDASE